ncbi:MAG: hypothetical protein J0I19_06150 [Alphaproteobacteria bacterium]|nr:hypothetical protein [Alphaproteobacteria bacterium]
MTMDKPDTIDRRVNKVAAYATALAAKYLTARRKLATVTPMMERDLASIFDNSYGAHIFIDLRLTLTIDLVRDLWAFIFDGDPRAPSLKNVWGMIQNPELLGALRERHGAPISGTDSLDEGDWTQEEIEIWRDLWAESDRSRQGAAFDDAYRRISEALPNLLSSDRAERLKRARSKAIAHYEMKATKTGAELHNLSDVGLKMHDARLFMEEIDPIIWDVVLLATWGSYDVSGFENRDKLYVADFWSRLQGKGPIKEIE